MQCAQLIQPLTDLLRCKARKLDFMDTTQGAFAKLRQAMSNVSSLSHLDLSLWAARLTDASGTAVGATVQQL